MAVEVTIGPAFKVGTPRVLFATPIFGAATAATSVFRYDVAPDGKRFLINTLGTETASAPITVVLNWPTAVKR